MKYMFILHAYTVFMANNTVLPLLVINVFLVTSGLTKACGRAVIIIHYSIILPQHLLYNLNISCTYERQDADIKYW